MAAVASDVSEDDVRRIVVRTVFVEVVNTAIGRPLAPPLDQLAAEPTWQWQVAVRCNEIGR